MSLDNLTPEQQAFANSMQAAGIPITEAELKARFEAMADDEGLAFKNPGEQSAWWRWLKAIAVIPVQWLIEYLITQVLPALFVKTAGGIYLDMHGWSRGVIRKAATKAQGVILFSRASTGTSQTIAAGTVIETAPINGTVYKVKTTAPGVFSAADSQIAIPVEALGTGDAYNLAANYYVKLAQPIPGITQITNNADWLTRPGSNVETDDDYRLRIRARFSSLASYHVNAAYKSLVSEFSGIDIDRIFVDETKAPRGPGSADGLILFDVGTASQSIIADINRYIADQGFHGLGDDFQVKPMPETQHDLVGTLWVGRGTSVATQAEILSNVEQMVRCAFRENAAYTLTQTWPTKRFSFGVLTAEILDRQSGLLSIEWGQSDIQNGWNIPRIQSLTLTVQEVPS